MHRLIRFAHMQGIGIGVGIDRHRLDPHRARRADDPAGDLAAIGNQDLLEHLTHSPRRSPSPFVSCTYRLATQSGMLSCFFQGLLNCLSRSIASERHRRFRVECGMMTSSMKPRAPATKGLANFSRYSSVRSAIFCLSLISARKMISTAPFGPMTAISAVNQ